SRRCVERRRAARLSVRGYGWAGLGVIGAAEVLLFAGEPTVARWFTPIVWTGYVLFVDALSARFSGRSYLTPDRAAGRLVARASVGCWWLFELYNAPRFWRGGADAEGIWWRYHGLEPNLFLRRVGYDWAFATIFPAIFLTAAVLRATIFHRARVRPWRLSPRVLSVMLAAGAGGAVLPPLLLSPRLPPLPLRAPVLLPEPLDFPPGRPPLAALL